MVCEKFKVKRITGCLIVLGVSFAISMLSVLGYSVWSSVTIFGKQFLDFFDFISNNILMPIVALLTCILIGYVAKTKYVEDEVELGGQKFKSKGLYRVMIRFVAPVFLVIILVSSLLGIV